MTFKIIHFPNFEISASLELAPHLTVSKFNMLPRLLEEIRYASFAKERNPNINIELVSSNEIEDKTRHLSAIWEKVLVVQNTLKLHCVKACEMDKISASPTSMFLTNIHPQ